MFRPFFLKTFLNHSNFIWIVDIFHLCKIKIWVFCIDRKLLKQHFTYNNSKRKYVAFQIKLIFFCKGIRWNIRLSISWMKIGFFLINFKYFKYNYNFYNTFTYFRMISFPKICNLCDVTFSYKNIPRLKIIVNYFIFNEEI